MLCKHEYPVSVGSSCRDLAEELGLHAFVFTNSGSSVLGMYIGD